MARADIVTNENSRVLILSNRGLEHHVADSCLYEFEDIIAEVDCADFFIPTQSYDRSRKVFNGIQKITRSRSLARVLSPDPNATTLDRDYDLLFMIAASPSRIFPIRSLKNWRQRSQKAVCYLVEIWQELIEQRWQPHIELLREFDHIFVGVHHAVDLVAELTGRPCSYLPPGVDTVTFCPYPLLPRRHIDVAYIGRRSSVTHESLLSLAEAGRLHYFYDTAISKTFFVPYPRQHRQLIANLLKRSRYFVTNHANANQPEKTGGKQEIGYRFMEGAAAGTVMIGNPPDTAVFRHYFDWDDAVIKIPFDVPEIGDILSKLDSQPERLERIRRTNVVNALRRHDWLHRWQTILAHVGMDCSPEASARAVALDTLLQAAIGHPPDARQDLQPASALNLSLDPCVVSG
ncbi:MAG: glycosyltransferase [Synechococcales cyanobacterium M58_A2018_015]|nr:glycosyltransferase [Synechococcales cyanobacterium M58_A2018_015]